MPEPTKPPRAWRSKRMRVTRRSLVGFACLAPFARSPAHAAERINIAELWAEGAEFSHKARGLAGKTVELRGYMAPPLKPEVDFFVLTTLPMAVCPFCDNASERRPTPPPDSSAACGCATRSTQGFDVAGYKHASAEP